MVNPVTEEAGRRVFARSGYLDAKITDIAAEAGRSVGSFCQHFAGKDELLQVLLADWTAQAGVELAGHPAGDDLSEEPALRARVAMYWHTYRAHLPEIRALGQAAQVSPAFNALLEGFCATWIAEDGEPIGRILSDDEAIDTLTGLLTHGLTGPRRQPRD